jgi:YfiR/HmsC-like
MLQIIKAKQKISLLIALLSIVSAIGPAAMADQAEDISVITALTLNLARFTEWPKNLKAKEAEIRLCVIGDNVVQQAFEKLDATSVGSKKIQTVQLTRLKNFEQCHVLFINGIDRSTVLQLLNEIKSQPILTVSDEDNHFLADSGMVVFKIVEGKVNIEINLNAVKSAGLEINSRVLKLATIVNP